MENEAPIKREQEWLDIGVAHAEKVAEDNDLSDCPSTSSDYLPETSIPQLVRERMVYLRDEHPDPTRDICIGILTFLDPFVEQNDAKDEENKTISDEGSLASDSEEEKHVEECTSRKSSILEIPPLDGCYSLEQIAEMDLSFFGDSVNFRNDPKDKGFKIFLKDGKIKMMRAGSMYFACNDAFARPRRVLAGKWVVKSYDSGPSIDFVRIGE